MFSESVKITRKLCSPASETTGWHANTRSLVTSPWFINVGFNGRIAAGEVPSTTALTIWAPLFLGISSFVYVKSTWSEIVNACLPPTSDIVHQELGRSGSTRSFDLGRPSLGRPAETPCRVPNRRSARSTKITNTATETTHRGTDPNATKTSA